MCHFVNTASCWGTLCTEVCTLQCSRQYVPYLIILSITCFSDWFFQWSTASTLNSNLYWPWCALFDISQNKIFLPRVIKIWIESLPATCIAVWQISSNDLECFSYCTTTLVRSSSIFTGSILREKFPRSSRSGKMWVLFLYRGVWRWSSTFPRLYASSTSVSLLRLNDIKQSQLTKSFWQWIIQLKFHSCERNMHFWMGGVDELTLAGTSQKAALLWHISLADIQWTIIFCIILYIPYGHAYFLVRLGLFPCQ